MSSIYRLLCMNHDPALAIDRGSWDSPEPAIAAALEPAMYDWLVEDHGKCDLLVGRYSASLVEVCCPASRERLAHNTHNGPNWIDKDWLVLLRAAMAAPADPGLAAALEPLTRYHACWTWERVDRLGSELGIEAQRNARTTTAPRQLFADAVQHGLAAWSLRNLEEARTLRINEVDARRFGVGEGDSAFGLSIEIDVSVPLAKARIQGPGHALVTIELPSE